MSSAPNSHDMKLLSCILPAYQEEANLEPTVESMLASLRSKGLSFEIVIVNDGSRDRTASIADHLATTHNEVTVRHQENQGIGGAFCTGVLAARGEYVILWPADMPMNAADIEPFLGPLGKFDVIVGVRPRREGYHLLMLFNSAVYVAMLRVFCGLKLKDVNWICAYRRSILEGVRFQEKGVPMLAEMLLVARQKGASFVEVTSLMKERLNGRPSASRIGIMWKTLSGLIRLCVRFKS